MSRFMQPSCQGKCFVSLFVPKGKPFPDFRLIGLLLFQSFIKFVFFTEAVSILVLLTHPVLDCLVIAIQHDDMTIQRPIKLWSIEYIFNLDRARLSTRNLKGELPKNARDFSTNVTNANVSAFGAPYFISVSLNTLLPSSQSILNPDAVFLKWLPLKHLCPSLGTCLALALRTVPALFSRRLPELFHSIRTSSVCSESVAASGKFCCVSSNEFSVVVCKS